MERPSHTIIRTSHRHRLPFLALAASIQIGIAWLFMHGLATGHFIDPHTLDFTPVKDQAKPKNDAPPPLPVLKKLEITPIKPIIFDTAGPDRGTIIATQPSGGGGTGTPIQPPPVIPDRPAIGIAATHTTPPYPVVARRTGAEGKVTLLLTVAPTGRVSAAQITASSGNDALDQAARQWVLAHWAYRPALDHGQPVASQATATMAFSLKDAR